MDRIAENMADLVSQITGEYQDVEGYKDTSYYLQDSVKQIYSLIIVPDDDHPLLKAPRLMILVRVTADNIVIEVDTTDRPLYQALVRAGIPREKIILRYAGETLPEHMHPQPEGD
jgi:hypothetical protein